ncbi:hypothetical protein [Prochlorothrix hollandica]|uniref:Uncharacterized protein n=1 Tax=Prochlorothrix hollandica PCC 9006 = CALU 1027 TaxID=317619 RepID=A0A0M2PPC8_PROHO|nr:hypothetical protein [Prochlorothrix hollandica]KKI98119.1 hypothetical protein PROH_20660 [Prochlorothrix hollandica PCC 9006 = CALU 1027]
MSTCTKHPLENPISNTKSTLIHQEGAVLKTDANLDRLKRLYQVSHQAEFLYLQAEADTLLCQLETEIKGRRLAHTY